MLFGGAIFGLFSGMYYWFPKLFGRIMNDRIGKVHFWMMMIGFNLTFGPFHILGLKGMPRRIYRYDAGYGWDFWNMVSSVGAFVIALSALVFMGNWAYSRRFGKKVSADPWDARTLEWTIPSPPPEYNFLEVPQVHARDDFWHRKYKEDKRGRPVPVPVGGSDEAHAEHSEDGHGIHLPSPSYFPLVAASGIPLMAYGAMFHWWWLMGIGAVIVLGGFYGWILEPATEEEAH